MASNEPTSLDELFAAAMQEKRRADHQKELESVRKTRKVKPEPVAETASLYANPDNWVRGRGIAVIHEESKTLLGNFIEWTHRTEASCRRLVRTEEILAISAIEHVSGEWWIAEHHEIAAPQVWHEKHEFVGQILLDKLGVHSPITEIVVHLSYGAIARVELAEDTQFAQVAGAPEQLFFLPKGTNILPSMSRDCKIDLKVQLERMKGEV